MYGKLRVNSCRIDNGSRLLGPCPTAHVTAKCCRVSKRTVAPGWSWQAKPLRDADFTTHAGGRPVRHENVAGGGRRQPRLEEARPRGAPPGKHRKGRWQLQAPIPIGMAVTRINLCNALAKMCCVHLAIVINLHCFLPWLWILAAPVVIFFCFSFRSSP